MPSIACNVSIQSDTGVTVSENVNLPVGAATAVTDLLIPAGGSDVVNLQLDDLTQVRTFAMTASRSDEMVSIMGGNGAAMRIAGPVLFLGDAIQVAFGSLATLTVDASASDADVYVRILVGYNV